jgi:chromosome segregation ATPase
MKIINNDIDNNSFRENKINELEEEIEALKIKNSNEIKSKTDKIEELLEIIKNKDKQIEQNKRSEDSSKFLNNINNEEFEELKKKYESAFQDCENYKLINNKLLEELNEKNKNIDSNDEYNNLIEEKNNLNKSIENLKDILSEKEIENKELKQRVVQLQNELKNNKNAKTERNPFRDRQTFNNELDIQKGENRYSMGVKENRAEKYKKMVMDYENQIGNDLSQMNMLKSDIKSLKNKLKENEKNLREIKQLIQIGYKGINPSNKTQKEAVKKLQEFLNKE